MKPNFWLNAKHQDIGASTEWFDVTAAIARKGKDWEDFWARLAGVVGIPC
jgi:hypothetical protein